MRGDSVVIYTSSKCVEPLILEKLYDEYMYYDSDGKIIPDAERIESRGVVHLGRKASWFRGEMERQDSYLEQALVNDRCVGFCQYYIENVEQAHETVHSFAARNHATKVGYIYLVCVDEGWTRMGIGKTLAYRAMSTFLAKNVRVATLEIAVKPRINLRSKDLFERAGWKDSGILTNYEVHGSSIGYSQYEWINPSLFV